MDKYRNYDIAFVGLKNGKHEFQFEIGKAFFELFDTEQEFTNPRIVAEALLEKHSTFLELTIRTSGTVNLVCDLTGSPFDYPIDNTLKVLVKYGETYDDTNEEVITIPHSDHAFNIAQLVYEDVMLSIPMKKISPEVSEEDWAILEQYNPSEPDGQEDEESEGDPRWEALKKLKEKN
ncbi:YceD family protein [Bergeyella sp. RCAD1439]|uniref:YceD family protein n=1 Tax=Bergeyella anatis TaxID=3113737 RepID=UPI002E17D50C|nr:DUF177 domain-containing protein [Bergeyella sp. RCAD1439]